MNPEPEFIIQKVKFLNMSEDERQKRHKGRLVNLAQIQSWNTYYKSNMDRLQNLDKNMYSARFSITPCECNPTLNELVSLWKGDITKLALDAIVNAANDSLLGGLGVDGAIHEAAGQFLYDECKILLGCKTGNAKITGGYCLPAKYVIHTVGPKGEHPELLESCYNASFNVLLENNLRTIAFPCISAGLYGYPQDAAASVAIKTVRKFLEENSSSVDRVIFCLFQDKDLEIYETMMQLIFPVQ